MMDKGIIIAECDLILRKVKDFYALKKFANEDQMEVVQALKPMFEAIKKSAEAIQVLIKRS